MEKKPRSLQDIKIKSEVVEKAHLVEGWTIRYEELSQHDFSQTGEDGRTEVFFKQIEKHLLNHIERYEVIVGCAAWLTNDRILKALAKRAGVSLVIQKEDFFRPDIAADKEWARKLRALYENLPRTLTKSDFEGTLLRDMWLGDHYGPEIEPVRCIGNLNTDKSPAFPRSHHKFIVFCNREDNGSIAPTAVWTGSYNFSKTAECSFENAVVLYDDNIVHAFFNEYIQIVSLSEPLDWKTEWAAPEWYKWDRKQRMYTGKSFHSTMVSKNNPLRENREVLRAKMAAIGIPPCQIPKTLITIYSASGPCGSSLTRNSAPCVETSFTVLVRGTAGSTS